jgi:hypothetical protein
MISYSQDICTLWRACDLISFTLCLTGPVDYPFASRHEGSGFKSPWGYLRETGILLLVLSRYLGDPDVILITGFHCPSVDASLGSAPTMCKASDFVALQWVLL